MRRPKLALQVPASHTIIVSATGAADSLLHGTLLCGHVPPQCEIRVTLARVGRLKRGNDDDASKKLLCELGFLGSQKEQKREQFDCEAAEKLCGCLISLPRGSSGSKTAKCDFDLPVPSYLPATAALPFVDISYAVFATCTLPNGRVWQTGQDLRIIRETAEPIRLEPSRTVSFPETSFAVRASFGVPEFDSRRFGIQTTLQLDGLNLPITNSMRVTETRWLVPREIRWELEETAVIVTSCPDATGHVPMSSAQRMLQKRKLATGKEKLKLKYPFTRPGNTPIAMLPDNSGMSIPFTVSAPATISLGDSTALAVAGSHILHTVRDAESASDPDALQQRFAVYLEYKLHIWLRIGEDVFDEASGDLVNRKMDEMAYTVVCPLTPQAAQAQDGQDQPPPMIPPSYDAVCEQPPEYATSPDHMAYS